MRPLYQRNTSQKTRTKRAIRAMMTISLVGAVLTATLYACMYNSGYKDTLNLEDIQLIQLDEPEPGAPTAVVHTTMGDISFELFPDQAPEAVKNFQALAQSGFYDNTYVFRVEKDIFFAAGGKDTSGELGDAYDESHETIKQELSEDLWPFRGAMCALRTGEEGGFLDRLLSKQTYLNGSRFVVVNSIEMTQEVQDALFEDNEGNKVAQTFVDYGGIPNYSRQLTVFAQAYAGLDVLDAITGVQLTGEEGKLRPAEDVLITSVTLGTYDDDENSTVSTELSTMVAQ